MARQAKNNVNKFKGLEDSPAIQGIEKIYEANEEARQKRVSEAMEKQQKEQQEKQEEEQQTEQTAVEAEPTPQAAAPLPSPVSTAAPASEPVARKSGKKTQNGITIYVPMEYYMQILQMKMETGVPIKDIALNAVIEYLDRHKNDQM